MKLGVLLLAAGASSRMGRPKLLLPWKEGTVLSHLLNQWQQIGPCQIAVVHSAANVALTNELDRLHWPRSRRIPNPAPELGMFSSIQCAARWKGWVADLTHWAIALGDQPLVRSETLCQLIAFATAHSTSVSQPSRLGRGRHPVILPAGVFSRLADAEAADLKQFLLATAQTPARCEMEDPGLDLDLDDPNDYERALIALG